MSVADDDRLVEQAEGYVQHDRDVKTYESHEDQCWEEQQRELGSHTEPPEETPLPQCCAPCRRVLGVDEVEWFNRGGSRMERADAAAAGRGGVGEAAGEKLLEGDEAAAPGAAPADGQGSGQAPTPTVTELKTVRGPGGEKHEVDVTPGDQYPEMQPGTEVSYGVPAAEGDELRIRPIPFVNEEERVMGMDLATAGEELSPFEVVSLIDEVRTEMADVRARSTVGQDSPGATATPSDPPPGSAAPPALPDLLDLTRRCNRGDGHDDDCAHLNWSPPSTVPRTTCGLLIPVPETRVWIRLLRDVRGDFPIGHLALARAGVYHAYSNPQGALSVTAENGNRLGIKPGEFEACEAPPVHKAKDLPGGEDLWGDVTEVSPEDLAGAMRSEFEEEPDEPVPPTQMLLELETLAQAMHDLDVIECGSLPAWDRLQDDPKTPYREKAAAIFLKASEILDEESTCECGGRIVPWISDDESCTLGERCDSCPKTWMDQVPGPPPDAVPDPEQLTQMEVLAQHSAKLHTLAIKTAGRTPPSFLSPRARKIIERMEERVRPRPEIKDHPADGVNSAAIEFDDEPTGLLACSPELLPHVPDHKLVHAGLSDEAIADLKAERNDPVANYAARVARSNILRSDPGQGFEAGVRGVRCPVCHWTFAKSEAEGCVPGNCSWRPEARGKPAHKAEHASSLLLPFIRTLDQIQLVTPEAWDTLVQMGHRARDRKAPSDSATPKSEDPPGSARPPKTCVIPDCDEPHEDGVDGSPGSAYCSAHAKTAGCQSHLGTPSDPIPCAGCGDTEEPLAGKLLRCAGCLAKALDAELTPDRVASIFEQFVLRRDLSPELVVTTLFGGFDVEIGRGLIEKAMEVYPFLRRPGAKDSDEGEKLHSLYVEIREVAKLLQDADPMSKDGMNQAIETAARSLWSLLPVGDFTEKTGKWPTPEVKELDDFWKKHLPDAAAPDDVISLKAEELWEHFEEWGALQRGEPEEGLCDSSWCCEYAGENLTVHCRLRSGHEGRHESEFPGQPDSQIIWPVDSPTPNPKEEITAGIVTEIAIRRREIIAQGTSEWEFERAAAAYASSAGDLRGQGNFLWPWEPTGFIELSRRRELITSAALAVAAIERIDRKDARCDCGTVGCSGVHTGPDGKAER